MREYSKGKTQLDQKIDHADGVWALINITKYGQDTNQIKGMGAWGVTV